MPRFFRSGFLILSLAWGPGMDLRAQEEGGGLPPGLPDGWYARIDTSMGTILARLLPEQAPQSVAHFAALAQGRLPWIDPLTGTTKQGHYYDGLLVHKAEAAQRFETGDPTATGRGAPLFYVPIEGVGPINFHQPWRLGMTRSSQGKISGVLFFVTVSSLPHLSGRHPCFGEVVSGKKVVRSICSVKTLSDGKPLEPIVVERLRVLKAGEPPPPPGSGPVPPAC